MRASICLAVAFPVGCLAALLALPGVRKAQPRASDSKPRSEAAEKGRKFEFTYRATAKDLPPGAGLVRVWIPLAVSDANQKVTVKRISTPVPTRVTREPRYGNRMLYAEIRRPKDSQLVFSVDYEVIRKQYSKGDYASLIRYNREPEKLPAGVQRFLQPDSLVPSDGRMRQIAEENTKGREGAVEKAHALYDYVFRTMRYDKSGTGWGRGDSIWACDAKRGNCTDFHSLFISLARAENIPARFEIGFPLPDGSHQGSIPGYHCWAEFYVPGPGWIPVDISEAWKNPSKHDYFFGTLDANRVQFSAGRDLTLVPKQQGSPVNYFVYPYMEIDGVPYERLEKSFAFREEQGAALAELDDWNKPAASAAGPLF
jgi:transglutaminase-like putative cysteine protease